LLKLGFKANIAAGITVDSLLDPSLRKLLIINQIQLNQLRDRRRQTPLFQFGRASGPE